MDNLESQDDMQSEQAVIRIHQLPEEIILRIVEHLDSPPVTVILKQQVPSSALFSPNVEGCGLKSFSRVCQDWRRIAFPFLFKHIKISPDFLISRVFNPADDPRVTVSTSAIEFDEYRLTREGSFFDWAKCKELDKITTSILLFVTEDSPSCLLADRYEEHTGVIEARRNEHCLKVLYHWLYSRLLTLFNPHKIVIIAPPSALGNMVGTTVRTSDLWAFDMPFQRLDICLATSSPADQVLKAIMTVHNFAIEGLAEVDYHAGSCLNLYGTFERDRHQDEYYNKFPPCILSTEMPSPCLAISPTCLTSFTYRQVFPHLPLFQRVLRILARLYNLRRVAFQLAPAASSGILDDTALISHGHLRLRDCWMEVERGYTEAVRVLLGDDDFELRIRVEEPTKQLPALKEFTSHDCDTPVIRDDLEKLFRRDAVAWMSAGVGRWTLSDDTI